MRQPTCSPRGRKVGVESGRRVSEGVGAGPGSGRGRAARTGPGATFGEDARERGDGPRGAAGGAVGGAGAPGRGPGRVAARGDTFSALTSVARPGPPAPAAGTAAALPARGGAAAGPDQVRARGAGCEPED